VDRKHFKILKASLTHLLNEWDPIGVADLISDEYDCMIGPLLSSLSKGDGRAQISEFLRNELETHFGLDPEGLDVVGMATRLVAWWAAVG
jgi:hypothetical protein